MWRYKYVKGKERKREKPAAELDMEPFGVSVSPEKQVVVTCSHTFVMSSGKVLFFRQDDSGLKLDRTVILDQLQSPRHAIVLPRKHLADGRETDAKSDNQLVAEDSVVICHGWNIWHYHRIFQFKVGRFELGQGYGSRGEETEQLKRPVSLTCDEDGLVLAVDLGNHRVHLLTRDLHFIRHLVTKTKHGIDSPHNVCLHPATGRMFIGQRDGSVRIFDACQPRL